MKNPKLIIKLNDNPIPNLCPLCDTETNPNIGAELFLIDTDNVVCFDCAEQHAPVLAALVTFADLARLFQVSESNYGERWAMNQNIKQSRMNGYQSFGVQKCEVRNA